jgi:Peptidoglycan-binding protein, CsiV
MHTMKQAIFGLALFAAQPGLAAVAEKESTYEIEVVVFENRLPELVGDELLARDAGQVKIRGLESTIVPDKADGSPYLAPTISGLLEQDGHHRVLAHLHWMQTVDAKSVAKPVRVTASNPAELDGTIRFYMSRFLHLDVNLLFRDMTAAGSSDPNAAVYRLSELRKVKSQETHYFDHPRLGVLVRVMPVEKEKDGEKSR